jgi:Protein kinase domain
MQGFMANPSQNEALSPPAPAERAGEAELARMVEDAKGSPLFSALLDWIDGFVLVLNEQRQIVLASTRAAEAFRVDNADELVGQRIGEAIGCVHAKLSPGGCGTSKHCRYCGALKAILDSKRFDSPIESECRITFGEAGAPETVKLHARACRADAKSSVFTVVVLRRSDFVQDAATAATCLETEADWPEDIETYRRVRKLGTGGMGSVFLVRDERRREYALKTARAALSLDDSVMSRFLKEIRLSIVLDHPNIVRTLRANQTPSGTLYMVTEYCPNGSAGQRLQRRGPLAAEVALAWLLGCTRALQYAWSEHRLIHRDIKPDNLLLDEDDQVKLADFGVARRALGSDPKMTLVGTFVGSIHYMAPEQAIAASDVDTRADLYGLGATFFELLTGSTPFDGPTPTVILSRKMTNRAPPVRSVRADVPPSLAECIDSLLATDANDRPSEPQALLDRLLFVADRERIEVLR